jgi:SOS-response transcriptional repressor LexA
VSVFISILAILDSFSIFASFSIQTTLYPSRMSINKLIRDGRKRLLMSEEDFAQALGVTRGTVQQWEKEGGTAPNRKRQPLVAKLLGVSVAHLMSGGADTTEGPSIGGTVPLLSSVQAGNFKEYVDNFQPGDGGSEGVPTSVPVGRHTFALRVSGDSMEPDFQAGMILIIEPDLEANPGDYVIAKNGDSETTFKQLVKDGGDWYLKPLNNRYPMKALGDSVIVGVLRAVEKRYR